MPQTIRLDQVLPGKVSYTKSDGSPHAAPAVATPTVSDPTKAKLIIASLTSSITAVQVQPLALGTVTVKLTGSDGSEVHDDITIVPALPPTATLVWDPPTPA